MSAATTVNPSTQKETIADHARVALGMKTWIADAYANIVIASATQSHSDTSLLLAFNTLTSDDSGDVEPLSIALSLWRVKCCASIKWILY